MSKKGKKQKKPRKVEAVATLQSSQEPVDDFHSELEAPGSKKDMLDAKACLEARAHAGHSLHGLQMREAKLQGLNLVRRHSSVGYDFCNSDLYRADLRDAHLFAINLSGTSLMKARLTGANLHCANLTDCNLLGADLTRTRLENVEWGVHILQHEQARQARRDGRKTESHDLFEQAEEVYRNIRKVCEKQGLFGQAGNFFYQEMVMRRMQMPLFSLERLTSWMVEAFCGYGERPLRVVAISLLLIFFSALAYFYLGIGSPQAPLQYSQAADLMQNLQTLGDCIYFSVVTFTTLGYGDITPFGLSRYIAALEAFIGSFTIALFVVVFVKKMTR